MKYFTVKKKSSVHRKSQTCDIHERIELSSPLFINHIQFFGATMSLIRLIELKSIKKIWSNNQSDLIDLEPPNGRPFGSKSIGK